MEKTKAFFKKYWGTILIYAALILFYWAMTSSGKLNAYLFPKIGAIGRAFYDNRDNMLVNLVSSIGMMIPSIIISIVVALSIGTLLGLHAKIRDALHPVIYAFSVIPSILLSPFALLLAPTFRAASIFLIVYGSFWSTLFATITGIMTIDKRYLDNASTLELKGFKKLFRVILPAASPSILAGFVPSQHLRNAGIRGDVRRSVRHGLLRKEVFGIWHIRKRLGRLHIHGSDTRYRDAAL